MAGPNAHSAVSQGSPANAGGSAGEGITSVDPYAPKELHMPKEVEEWFQALNPSFFKSYKDIEATWNHPLTQATLAVVGDPQFKAALTELSHQDHLASTLFGYEALWVIVIWTFKSWRLTKVSTWIRRLWVQLWVGTVFWWGALLIVPFIVMGNSFKVLIGQVLKAVIHHFF